MSILFIIIIIIFLWWNSLGSVLIIPWGLGAHIQYYYRNDCPFHAYQNHLVWFSLNIHLIILQINYDQNKTISQRTWPLLFNRRSRKYLIQAFPREAMRRRLEEVSAAIFHAQSIRAWTGPCLGKILVIILVGLSNN